MLYFITHYWTYYYFHVFAVLENAALNILIHTYFKFFCGQSSFPGVYTEDIFLEICGHNYYAPKGHWHSHQ